MPGSIQSRSCLDDPAFETTTTGRAVTDPGHARVGRVGRFRALVDSHQPDDLVRALLSQGGRALHGLAGSGPGLP